MIFAPFNHTKQLRMTVRFGQWLLKVPLVGGYLSFMCEYFIRIYFSSDISCRAVIPGDVVFVHGQDIVIGSTVRIGRGCKIFNGVTLGNKFTEGTENDQPIIGDHCVISTGAKVLGGIRVGDHVIIGANSVVLMDIPAYSVAVGVPARVVKVMKESTKLRVTTGIEEEPI